MRCTQIWDFSGQIYVTLIMSFLAVDVRVLGNWQSNMQRKVVATQIEFNFYLRLKIHGFLIRMLDLKGKQRNMYIEVLSEKSGKIVVLPTTKGCLCSDRKIQDDPAVKTLTGENLFFWSFILFSETVLHASCLLRPTFTQFPDPGSINGLVTRPHQSHQGWHQFSPQKNEETRIVFTLNNFKVALEVPNENCMHFRFIIISVSSYFLILFNVVLVFPPL